MHFLMRAHLAAGDAGALDPVMVFLAAAAADAPLPVVIGEAAQSAAPAETVLPVVGFIADLAAAFAAAPDPGVTQETAPAWGLDRPPMLGMGIHGGVGSVEDETGGCRLTVCGAGRTALPPVLAA